MDLKCTFSLKAEPFINSGAHLNKWLTIFMLSYNLSGSMIVHKSVSLMPKDLNIFLKQIILL